jgi:hypothetical protein
MKSYFALPALWLDTVLLWEVSVFALVEMFFIPDEVCDTYETYFFSILFSARWIFSCDPTWLICFYNVGTFSKA